MKLEAGKEYETREGDRARIYATDGASPYPFHGAWLDRSGWIVGQWESNGHWLHEGTHPNDLMLPKLTLWVNFYRHSYHGVLTYSYLTKEAAEQAQERVGESLQLSASKFLGMRELTFEEPAE